MGEQSNLGGITTADLKRELQRRQTAADMNVLRRVELIKELEEIERELAVLQGGRNGKVKVSSGVKPLELAPRRRHEAPNDTTKLNAGVTLLDAVLSATIAGQRYTPTQAAEKVLAAGYVTKTKKLNMTVSGVLTTDTDHWKKVMRGLYERIK